MSVKNNEAEPTLATTKDQTSETSLQTKITQLYRAREKAESVLNTGKKRLIARHVETLKETLSEVNQLRRKVEASKIAESINEDEIDQWNTEVENKMEEADATIEMLEEWLRNLDVKIEQQQRDEKAERENQEREKQLQFEFKLHETKVKLQAEITANPDKSAQTNNNALKLQAKLPKLQITRFNGTYADWPRFWSLYSETIDKSGVPAVSKFSYLRELLCEKARKTIEALPHTAEGYNRAVSILEDRFGKNSEIVKTYVKEIMDLPNIGSVNVKKIHDFYEKLAYCVQSLETLKQLDAINGTVSMILDKLSVIRGDLVRNDSSWESWNFVQFAEALKFWTRRNPVVEDVKFDDPPKKRDRRSQGMYQTQQNRNRGAENPRACVYCNASDHRSSGCDSAKTAEERKSILATKKLCFNCTGPAHRASECRSTATCRNCHKRHHTSICNETKEAKPKTEPVLAARGEEEKEVIYPIILVEIDGIKTHALLDTGAGSSYASAKLIDILKKKPKEVKTRRVEMMLSSRTTKVEIYSANLAAVDGKFSMEIELSKVDKPQLMMANNPNYNKLLEKYNHLKGVKIDDPDKRKQFPIHVVLGASEYAAIKTATSQKVGLLGQPVAEKTLLGWTIMSAGREDEESPVLFTQTTTTTDYEQLCALDVLGLADTHEDDQQIVYKEFQEQLERNEAGWYLTNLPWKGNHPTLATNEMGSKRRLEQLIRKLKKDGIYEEYNDIIQDQLQQGIIETTPKEPTGKEFYIPHKSVIKKEAESTNLRIVYDASARETNNQPSLNDCLHPGPPLQNQLWDIVVRARFHPILLTGDLKKAFLQIRIKKEERDSLRFHWKEPNSDKLKVYRFTRALFGLTSSPFLLAGVLHQHLDSWKDRFPTLVEELRNGLYVDDLMTGGITVEEIKEKKAIITEVFEDATFTIHKWHSNDIQLEAPGESSTDSEVTYAKQQLGGGGPLEGKLLGLPWDREQDTISVILKVEDCTTKRGVLSQLAKVYDPLGLVSPTTLTAKLLFRDICDTKMAWDARLPDPLLKRWKDWKDSLTENFIVPRPLTPHRFPTSKITLHAFGDASSQGVSSAVYAVVHQVQEVTQGLVCAKSRIAKRNLTIPRLELIAGHMAVNLVSNVESTLDSQEVEIHCWLDSTVALYWIKGKGDYRQFVANRVQKIQQHKQVTWHHVPTQENPADLGSRGGNAVSNQLWREGPKWLRNRSEWPPDVTLESTTETKAEAKVMQEIFAAVSNKQDAFDLLLDKHKLPKILRIGAWIQRFIWNCKNKPQEKKSGPINTEEVQQYKLWWIRRVQQAAQQDTHFQSDQLQLNLQLNEQQILECRGRITGEYPIYLPDKHPFTSLLVYQEHVSTLHGGVGLTMAKVREHYWVPRLRSLAKKIRRNCHGCRRFQVKAFQAPPPASLPSTRTEGSMPFQVLGVDFAGPIKYKIKPKKEGKAYLALFACSLTRAVHLELVKSLEADDFILCLKKFIARRGRPELVYSDNGTTFKATEKWLRQVQEDEKFNSFLASMSIKWRFNLSRAPWWGGQFERLIGLFKNAFYKTIGNGTLKWSELEEVVLDVEVTLNNRPLTYLEDDVQQPTLTPNSMLQINLSYLPELEAYHITENDLKKRAKFLKRCKEVIWKRWSREYVRSLREQHRRPGGEEAIYPKVGEVVIIRDEQQSARNRWKLAVVTRLIKGRDGIVRGAKLKTGKSILERAIQHLFPLELSCDRKQAPPLNPRAPEYHSRPRRDAAAAALARIQELAENED